MVQNCENWFTFDKVITDYVMSCFYGPPCSYRAALNARATSEMSVRPSVRLLNARIVAKQKEVLPRFLYRDITYSSFLRRRMVGI